VSLLLANGHTNAWRYPLGMLQDEVRLVHQRQDKQAACAMSGMYMAVAALLDSNAVRTFNDKIKELTHGEA